MRVRAILIAAALLVVALGGAAVWVAGNDDDEPSSELLSRSDEPDRTAPRPSEAETSPAPEPTPTSDGPIIEEDPPETETETEPAPKPETEPEPTTPAPEAKRKTHFEREPKGTRAGGAARRFTVPPAHEFSGEGNARLGTVDVKAPSILKWRTKGRFEVRFGRESFPIIAPSDTGQLALPPFRFEEVRVVATGPWRITISPQ